MTEALSLLAQRIRNPAYSAEPTFLRDSGNTGPADDADGLRSRSLNAKRRRGCGSARPLPQQDRNSMAKSLSQLGCMTTVTTSSMSASSTIWACFANAGCAATSFCNGPQSRALPMSSAIGMRAKPCSAAGPIAPKSWRSTPRLSRPFGFEARSAAIIADLAGQYAPIMPRNVLKAQIARAAEMGFDVRAAFEFEVIFLNETASSLRARGFAPPAQFAADNKCWSGTTAATEAAFVTAWEQALLAHGIDLFGVGGELGPGCFEADA